MDVERVVQTVEDLKGQLKDDPGNYMLKYRVVFAEGVGVAWDKDQTFNAARGITMQIQCPCCRTGSD